MVDPGSREQVMQVCNLHDYFRSTIDEVLLRQRVDVDPHAAHYVVNLLTLYSRSDELYEDDGDCYNFYGSSGSCYSCYKESYCIRMNNAHIWTRLQELHGDKVKMMDEETDWLNMDWIIK